MKQHQGNKVIFLHSIDDHEARIRFYVRKIQNRVRVNWKKMCMGFSAYHQWTKCILWGILLKAVDPVYCDKFTCVRVFSVEPVQSTMEFTQWTISIRRRGRIIASLPRLIQSAILFLSQKCTTSLSCSQCTHQAPSRVTFVSLTNQCAFGSQAGTLSWMTSNNYRKRFGNLKSFRFSDQNI